MLNGRIEKFKYSDEPGYHFPDAIVEAFLKASPSALSDVSQTSNGAQFTLQESRNLILQAFDKFSPVLGDKARAIFDAGFDEAIQRNHIQAIEEPLSQNPSRWQLRTVKAGESSYERSVPANSTKNEINPANPNNHAVIQYEFDGTIRGVIYLGHELGHAIADDYQREAGYSYSDNPKHLVETQAYLTQHILYDFLNNHPDEVTRTASREHFLSTMTANIQALADVSRMHERPMSILTAQALHNQIKDSDENTRIQTTEMLLGKNGPKNINEVLARAGIERSSDMHLLAKQTIDLAMSHTKPDYQRTATLDNFPSRTNG